MRYARDHQRSFASKTESSRPNSTRLGVGEDVPEVGISHAVAADVWHSANIIKKTSIGIQKISPIYSSSHLPNGASDSTIFRWDLKAKFIKITEVQTKAGIFEAEHIQYFEKDNSLWLEMWCTNDIDRIMLKMYYPVYNSYYVLKQLDRE